MSSCALRRSATLPQTTNNKICRELSDLTYEQRDSLISALGENKIFVEEFLNPTLIALSYYPELRDTPIEFKLSKERTTMAARPVPMSMLLKRRYIILINDDEDFEGIHLGQVPLNAQVGIIGHELAHIADYENQNFFGVMGTLLRYSSASRKALFERQIDKATIERGLGWQLHDWAEFSLDAANSSTPEYIEFKRKHYLAPDEIVQYIDLYSRYSLEND